MKLSRTIASCVLVALAATLPIAAVAFGAPARKPNLTVTRGSAPAHMELGSSHTISVTVKNAGQASAAASNVKLTLSTSRRAGRTVLGSARVGALAAGATQVVLVRVSVPDNAPEGTQNLVVCADPAARIAESNEGDNCRASSTHVM